MHTFQFWPIIIRRLYIKHYKKDFKHYVYSVHTIHTNIYGFCIFIFVILYTARYWTVRTKTCSTSLLLHNKHTVMFDGNSLSNLHINSMICLIFSRGLLVSCNSVVWRKALPHSVYNVAINELCLVQISGLWGYMVTSKHSLPFQLHSDEAYCSRHCCKLPHKAAIVTFNNSHIARTINTWLDQIKT
jgi:hypothetical protein